MARSVHDTQGLAIAAQATATAAARAHFGLGAMARFAPAALGPGRWPVAGGGYVTLTERVPWDSPRAAGIRAVLPQLVHNEWATARQDPETGDWVTFTFEVPGLRRRPVLAGANTFSR